jgi:large subunit ribosomal protein L30
MLRRAKDYITWGEISQDSIALLLKRKGEITRKKKLTEETVKEIGFNSIKELANALYRGDVKLNKLRMKPVFRLHPPIGGYKRSILRPYRAGGELGYRGETINSILKRMM